MHMSLCNTDKYTYVLYCTYNQTIYTYVLKWVNATTKVSTEWKYFVNLLCYPTLHNYAIIQCLTKHCCTFTFLSFFLFTITSVNNEYELKLAFLNSILTFNFLTLKNFAQVAE